MARIWPLLISVCWCVGWCFGWCQPSSAPGAVVADMRLVSDGSAKPPGDRLDVSVLFLPGDEELTLEVRAFYRDPGGDQVQPLPTKDASRRGAAGELLVRVRVAQPADSRGVDVAIVVPYAALDLPPGEHEMAYEVRGLRGKTVDFVRATSMVLVTVSDRSRKTMVERPGQPQWANKQVERDAYVLKNGKLAESKVQLEVATPVPQAARTIQQVDIPGEFNHPVRIRVSAPRPAPLPEDAPRDPKLAALPLANTAWQALDKFEPESKRLVYFATNRNVAEAEGRGPDRFGKEITDLTYGSCLVNIPIEMHTGGKLELPGWWQRRDPEQHFLVESVTLLERAQFLAATDPTDVLLFVHGFNTTFELCVLRTAQLVHDLRFPGRGVAFSWPSAAAVTGYFHDEKMNEASVEALVQVLHGLVDARERAGKPARRIHVISHSMGNRLFLKAVRQFELDTAADSPGKIFGHVALAAPDVDASTFSALLPSLIRQAEHVTFYYCQSDRALTASRGSTSTNPWDWAPSSPRGSTRSTPTRSTRKSSGTDILPRRTNCCSISICSYDSIWLPISGIRHSVSGASILAIRIGHSRYLVRIFPKRSPARRQPHSAPRGALTRRARRGSSWQRPISMNGWCSPFRSLWRECTAALRMPKRRSNDTTRRTICGRRVSSFWLRWGSPSTRRRGSMMPTSTWPCRTSRGLRPATGGSWRDC